MTCKQCRSFAINHRLHGRDGSDPDLCDVCYWRKRAERKPLTVEKIREAVEDSNLDWHNGWTVGDEDSVNRYLNFARAVEAAHGIGGKT